MSTPRWLVVALCAAVSATPALARVVRDVEMPDQLVERGQTLRLNGTAVQQRFIFDVYAVALYLERPTQSAEDVLHSQQLKHVRLHLFHSLSAAMVGKALYGGFKHELSPEQLERLNPRIQQMIAAIPGVHSGENIDFTYDPATQVTRIHSDSGGHTEVVGQDFAEALFGIWLAPNTTTPKVKAGLLGG